MNHIRPVRTYIDHKIFEAAKALYKGKALSLESLLQSRQRRIEPHMTKKQQKALMHQKAFLEHELRYLDTVTVNDFTDDRMLVAAPDTHALLSAYLQRRLRDLVAMEGLTSGTPARKRRGASGNPSRKSL